MTVFAPGTLENDPKKQNYALQDHAKRLGTNTADIATNTADIATNAADIATNTADIATNTADIAANTADIATNTAAIATKLGAATQSDQETATSTTTGVTPGRQQYHPSASKAWVKFAGSGTNGAQTINASYNVSGVSRSSTGVYTVSFTISFSSANYAVITDGELSGTVITTQIAATSQAAGSVGIVFSNSSTAAQVDPTSGHLVAFGDQ